MDAVDSSTGGVSRYQHAAGWVGTLVEECERYDDDGVTVGFFNDALQVFPNNTFAKVADKFKRVRPAAPPTLLVSFVRASMTTWTHDSAPGCKGQQGRFVQPRHSGHSRQAGQSQDQAAHLDRYH